MPPTDLAGTPDRVIGLLRVCPASREVFHAGRSESVEPRVLQVLLTLHDAAGEVVTRDALIASCWNNRAVSEDAVNRAIAKVRHLAAGIGGGSFSVETIIKSGFRLHVHAVLTDRPDAVPTAAPQEAPPQASQSAPQQAPDAATDDGPRSPGRPVTGSPAPTTRSRWTAAVAVMALGGAIAAGWMALQRPASPDQVTAARDLHQRGLAAVFEGTPAQSAQGIGYLREAAALDPDDAQVWGSLAMAHVLSLRHQTPDAAPAVVARVREAAARGLALDAREGRSAAALVSLEPTFGHWTAKDRALREALARATPGSAPLIFQRIQFLANVGRLREAHALSGDVAATAPLLPWIQAARIELLSATGRPEEALRTAERAGELWPRDREVWFARFYAYLVNGRPELAQSLVAQRATWPTDSSEGELDRLRQLVDAVVTKSGANSLLAAYVADLSTQAYVDQAIRAAALLGRPDAALEVARRSLQGTVPPTSDGVVIRRIGLSSPSERSTAMLFVAPAQTLWRDSGFWPLADELGLIAFWKATGPPDFCASPEMSAECRRHGLTR